MMNRVTNACPPTRSIRPGITRLVAVALIVCIALPVSAQTPAGQTTTIGVAMDVASWVALIGAGAITGIAIWAILQAHDHPMTMTPAATTNANCMTNLAVLGNTVAEQAATLATATSLAAQAELALVTAGNGAGVAAFKSLEAGMTSTLNALNALQVQIQNAVASCTSAELASLVSQEETLRAQTNGLLSQLMALLTTYGSTTGVPSLGPAPLVRQAVASPSVPVYN
jgi:hypothetical protein